MTKDQNMKQKSKRNRNSLVVATWNVHTLVECSSDEQICRKQPMDVTKHGNHSDKPGKINRKTDFLVGELRCVCGMDPRDKVVWKKCVASESRYTFLHSGRPLPGDQERASRN